jgi:NRPS condensation-like uncharacterized protein
MLPVNMQDTVQEFLHGMMATNLGRVDQVQHVNDPCMKNVEATKIW